MGSSPPLKILAAGYASQEAPAACKILLETRPHEYSWTFSADIGESLTRFTACEWDACLLPYRAERFCGETFLNDLQVLASGIPRIVIIPPDHLGRLQTELAQLGVSECLVGMSLEPERLEKVLQFVVSRDRAQSAHRHQNFLNRLSCLSSFTLGMLPPALAEPPRVATLYPQQFRDLVDEYESLIELACSHPCSQAPTDMVSQPLAMLADKLIYVSAHAYDILDLHQEVMKRRQTHALTADARRFNDTALLALIGLLSNLCLHYRHYVTVSSRLGGAATASRPPIISNSLKASSDTGITDSRD